MARAPRTRSHIAKLLDAVTARTAVKRCRTLPRRGVYIIDIADVAVINFLVVVVLDLHDLVAGCEGPAEAFDLALAGGVQRRLQFDVERSCADAAAIHWAQHLDVANGVEAKPLGNASLHQFDDPRYGGLRI